MEREQLEQHQATLRGLRDTIGSMLRSGGDVDSRFVIELVESVAAVLNDLIDEQLVAGEHAAAVAEMIKRPGEPRMTLAGPRVVKTELSDADIQSISARNPRELAEPDPRD